MYHSKKCPLFIFFTILSVQGMYYSTSNNSQTRVLRTTKAGCFLPEHPPFGKWSVFSSSEIWLPYQKLPSGKFLEISCNDGYGLEGSPIMNCMNNEWINDIGKCLKKCSPLYNSTNLNITCHNKKQINCSEAVDGSRAEFQCKRFYEISNLESSTTIVCINGTWSSKIPQCVLACGKNKNLDSSLIVGGKVTNKGSYPWQVAIYNTKTKELICGGSLISLKVILTAAHCVTKDGSYSKKDFIVAVEKYHRQYSHPEDKSTQFSTVQEIFLPEGYRSINQRYNNDIAIIVTKLTFVLTENVRPICIDFDSRYLRKSINVSADGFVTGWGYTKEDGKPSEVLNELKVPPVDTISCMKHFSNRFPIDVLKDKVCAGHLDKSGMSVCKGDSGGGLVFKYYERFYVSGVVSLGPTSPRVTTYSCDSEQYGLYTNVSYHRNFIREKLAEAKILKPEDNIKTITETSISGFENNCVLPEHPQFGHWSVYDSFDGNYYLPGQVVQPGTRLEVKCQNQYILSGSTYLQCENGLWNFTMGKCLRTCTPLFNTKTMKVSCTPKKFPNTQLASEPCVNVTDGTLAHFECAPFYEDFTLTRNPIHICVNGKWDQTTPVCTPACGKLNDDTKEEKFFPWHVSIYNSTNKTLVCSGSLINERVVVTAGHCVKDHALNLMSEDNFLVSVGGHYRSFNDPRDIGHVQTSAIDHMFVPESSGELKTKGMYYQDIAILVTKRNFELTQRVLPVCLGKRLLVDSTGETINIYTSGWGYDIDKLNYPELLKTVKVSNPFTFCLTHSEFETFNKTLINDKICKSASEKGWMICFGDTGAGLVALRDDGRYYLSGVLSLSPNSSRTEGACNREKFLVETSTFFYLLDFILKKEAEYRPQLN